MNKKLSIVSPGGETVYDVDISPGNTGNDILKQIDLVPENHALVPGKDKQPLDLNADIFPLVEDRQKVYVIATPEAGGNTPASSPTVVGIRSQRGDPLFHQKELERLQQQMSNSIILELDKPKRPPISIMGVRDFDTKMYKDMHLPNYTRIYAGSVKKTSEPLWKEKDWYRSGDKYVGNYVTRLGTFSGEIVDKPYDGLQLYIFSPPRALRKHPHWPCFRHRGKSKYWLHLVDTCPDVESGIVTMETILNQAA
jgi:hypothetical protein